MSTNRRSPRYFKNVFRQEIRDIDGIEILRHGAFELGAFFGVGGRGHGGVDQPFGAHAFELVAVFGDR